MEEQKSAENFVLKSASEFMPFINARLKNIVHARKFVDLIGNKLAELEKGQGMRIIILCGLRGTGKTIGLIQLATRYPSPARSFFVRGDELLANNIGLNNLVEALDKTNRRKIGVDKKYCLFIDEVTYIPDWTLKVKVLHDTRPDLTLVLTSSSSLALAFPPDIARRSAIETVQPLSFREYLLLKHDVNIPDGLAKKILTQMTNGQIPLKELADALSKAETKNLEGLFEDYLQEDMPLALQVTGQEYAEGMKTLVRTIIYEDFPKHAKIDASLLPKAEQITFFLAKTPCDAIRLESLANHFQLSKESITKILSLLEKSLLTKGLEAHGRRKAVKLPKKWLFQSPSIRAALAKNLGLESDLTGNQREDAAHAALSAAFGPGSITYSHEADFIIAEKKLAFEVGHKRHEVIIPGFKVFTLTTARNTTKGNQIPLYQAMLAF